MRLASFNVQNMRLRRGPSGPRLDGARDRDTPADTTPAAPLLDARDRALTAQIIARANPDMLALQEVFDQPTLDHFHDHHLARTGTAPYPHRTCLPGNDGRGFDLAVMARQPPLAVISHADLTAMRAGLPVPPGIDPAARIFRRDCLEVALPGLAMFICHLKAPYPDTPATAQVRHLEALAIRHIIETRFPDPATARWLILGDLNEAHAGHGAAQPLRGGFSVDLMQRLPDQDRWTYRAPDGSFHAAPDVLLASPALAAAWPEAVPQIFRQGLGHEAARAGTTRLPGVGTHRPHASDHALICLDLPGLTD